MIAGPSIIYSALSLRLLSVNLLTGLISILDHNSFCLSLLSRPHTDKGQISSGLFRSPEIGAGEGVPLQQIHHHQAKGRAGKQRGALRETGKY